MSRNIKYTCGSTIPSACVLFTGDLPSFIPENSVPCDARIDDIFEKHADIIESHIDSLNLSGLNMRCFTFTSGKVKDFAQETIDKVCDLETSVLSLQAALNALNIGSHSVTIDLKCLKPVASPCALGTDTYTLLSILNILVNEICLIKSHLNL